MVSSAMSAVRIYRRKTFSRSWSVAGSFGVGGDSGAWIVQNSTHRVVGHVLAWCQRNHIAYLCPMEVLLEDIKRTLGARRIYLPGSAEHAEFADKKTRNTTKEQSGVDVGLDNLEKGVRRLGVVDSAVDMRSALELTSVSGPQNNIRLRGGVGRLESPRPETSRESDREVTSALRSTAIRAREGRARQLEMAVVP